MRLLVVNAGSSSLKLAALAGERGKHAEQWHERERGPCVRLGLQPDEESDRREGCVGRGHGPQLLQLLPEGARVDERLAARGQQGVHGELGQERSNEQWGTSVACVMSAGHDQEAQQRPDARDRV